MSSLRSELSVLTARRERAQQEWREVTGRKLREKVPAIVAELVGERQRLRSLVDRMDRELGAIGSQIQQIENDRIISRCSEL